MPDDVAEEVIEGIDIPVSGEVIDNGNTQSAVIHEGSAAAAQVATETPWYESASVNQELLTDKDKEYKSLEEYVKGAQHYRGLASQKGIIPPGADADQQALDAFKADIPEHLQGLFDQGAPEAYELEMLSSNENLTDDRKGDIMEAFKGLNLSNDTAGGVMQIFADQIGKDYELAEQYIKETREQSETALKAEDGWGDKYDERMAGVTQMEAKHPELVAAMKASGVTGRKDYLEFMDENFRSTGEDTTLADVGVASSDIDSQIAALKANPAYRNGNSFERKELTTKISALYAQKGKNKR